MPAVPRERTTRHVLSELGDADLGEEDVYILDARKRRYLPVSLAEGRPD